MAFIKKLAIGSIFISILCIFGMSHNVSAVVPTLDIDNYSLVRAYSSVNNSCVFSGGSNAVTTGQTYCQVQISGTTRLQSIETESTYSVKKNDIVIFYLFINSQTTSFEYQPILNMFGQVGHGWDIIGYNEVSVYKYYEDTQSHNGYINQQGINYDLNLDFYNYSGFQKIYEITARARADGDNYVGLYAGSNFIYSMNSNDVGQIIRFQIRNLSFYRYDGSKINKEQEEKTQEAVDDSQAAGSDSSSAASSGGASLLTAITGFFNVITSAQPTNCRFNAPLNTYFGNQRLNVDLCSLELPSGIGTLTSIIAICIIIPFAIHMFNKFIALFRSFQS